MTRTAVLLPTEGEKAEPQPAVKVETYKRSRAIKPPTPGKHPPVALTLFFDYNHFRSLTTSIQARRRRSPVADFKPSDERLTFFAKVVAWCAERKMDPRLWQYVLFSERRWCVPPQMLETVFCNEKSLWKYEKTRCLDGYRRYILPNSKLPVWDPNRDLAPANEMRKARLVADGNATRCMSEMLSDTFGFHPRSEVCRACPLGTPCREELERWADFPIMKLRLGEITAEEARKASLDAQERARELG